MALSEELQEIYASNTTGQIVYDTVVMYHPLFTQTFYLIADPTPRALRVEDGLGGFTTEVFTPFAFNISRPAKGSNQQDMQFNFDNVAQIGIEQLELAAEDMDTPITITFRPYIAGTDFPQATAIILSMTNVSATATSISGTASRTNLFGRKVPSRSYDPWIFKGVA